MSEQPDPLRSAFDEIRASVLPSMRPPGVDRVTETVRRRRNVRSAVAAIAVVLLVGTGFWIGGARIGKTGTPGTAPTMASADASASVSPSPESSIVAGQPPPRRPSTTPTTAKKAACVTDGVSVWDTGQYQVEFSSVTNRQTPPCAGYKLTIYWATYKKNPDGSGRLYASGTTYLDLAHMYRTVHVSAPADCGTVFIGHNWSSTPSTLSAYVMGDTFNPSPSQPFWDHKHDQGGLNFDIPLPCAPPVTASPS